MASASAGSTARVRWSPLATVVKPNGVLPTRNPLSFSQLWVSLDRLVISSSSCSASHEMM